MALASAVLVVTIRAAEGDDCRHCIPTPACSSRTLLVVRSGRRQIPKGDSRQNTNVDTDFHRCGAGQHIDGLAWLARVVRSQIDVLEQKLVLLCSREYLSHLGGVQLGSVFCGDEGHRLLRGVLEHGNSALAVVALAGHEHGVSFWVDLLGGAPPASEARTATRERPLDRTTGSTVCPFAANQKR
jgi:hypothetical protein